MSSHQEAAAILEEVHVLRRGHFLLSSGRHSDVYMQCARLFQRPEAAAKLCAMLADLWRGAGIETVIGPALGAVLPAYEVSRQLGCRNIFAEREGGAMALRRGFTLAQGERVLVVEDAVTTGGSAREVVELCLRLGADVVGVGAVVDRSHGRADFGVPFQAAYSADIASWPADNCPLCQQGFPVEKPGSRSTVHGESK